VWFLRDLWTGAGWGVVGADGAPKAAWHYLRRALAPIAVHVSDEGVNGLVVHVANDAASPIAGELEVTLYRGDAQVGRGRGAVHVPARGAAEVPALSLFEGFMDLGHAYRFGPPTCDLVVAALHWGEQGASTLEAFHFPLGLPRARAADVGLTGELRRREDGDLDLALTTKRFAQAIALELDGWAPDDAFFHLAPGASRTVRLRRAASASGKHPEVRAAGAQGSPKGRLTAMPLGAESALSIAVPA
jgi:beta-mannosidase